jgi:hypothetical protein
MRPLTIVCDLCSAVRFCEVLFTAVEISFIFSEGHTPCIESRIHDEFLHNEVFGKSSMSIARARGFLEWISRPRLT